MKIKTRRCLAIVGLGVLLPLHPTWANEEANVAEAFKQYAVEWEQWAWSIPRSVSPLLDLTGESCMIAQRGPVWFLAGVAVQNENGVGVATRSCTIPEGKWLFFPIANTYWFDTPGVCGQDNNSLSIEALRKGAADAIDQVKKPSALVDGKPINYMKRVKSGVFDISFPEDNVFDNFCGDLGGFPAGTYSPAVDDGYYAAIKPLKKGKHTIVIHSEGGNKQDVTYNLNIVPVKLK